MKVLNLIEEVAKERAADSEKTMPLNINHVFTIAKAFRELEQERDELRQRAEAAEAKLEELEKQEPVFQVEVSGNHWLNAGPLDDSDFSDLPDGINLLFARPATHTGSII